MSCCRGFPEIRGPFLGILIIGFIVGLLFGPWAPLYAFKLPFAYDLTKKRFAM